MADESLMSGYSTKEASLQQQDVSAGHILTKVAGVAPQQTPPSHLTVSGATGQATVKPTIPSTEVVPPHVAVSGSQITAHVTPGPTAPPTMVIPEVHAEYLTGITANAALQRAVAQAEVVMHPEEQPTAPVLTVLPSIVQPVHEIPIPLAQPKQILITQPPVVHAAPFGGLTAGTTRIRYEGMNPFTQELPCGGMSGLMPGRLTCEPQVFFQIVNGPDGKPLPGQKGADKDEKGNPLTEEEKKQREVSTPEEGKKRPGQRNWDPPTRGGDLGPEIQKWNWDDWDPKGSRRARTFDWPPREKRREVWGVWRVVNNKEKGLQVFCGKVLKLDTAVLNVKLNNGPCMLFFATADNCKDLVWVQYVLQTYTYYDAKGGIVATITEPNDGLPGLDRGRSTMGNQQQGVDGSSAFAEDAPGPEYQGGDRAGSAVRIFQDTSSRHKVQGATKFHLKADFWTYLICLCCHYEVYGHFEWGYECWVDSQGDEDSALSKPVVRDPVWH